MNSDEGGDNYGDGFAHGAARAVHGGPARRGGHARSVSHGGILISRDVPVLEHERPATEIPGDVTGLPIAESGRPHMGHHRTFSHGQVEGRGHRRESSRTDFILPAGHDQRERDRAHRTTTSASVFSKGHSRQASRTESVYTIRQHKKTMLQKILFWKKVPEEPHTRSVVPNHLVPVEVPLQSHPNGSYPDNRIRTTKYTVLSFLPKNLFEQFHRFANLYFLFIVLLNFVPSVQAFGKEVAMLPLVFVLGITAIKDAFEDRRRYNSDKRVNNATCRVYCGDQQRYMKARWKDVRVGDIIHLSCNEFIPADIVVLNTSDEHGLCFIESSNLDGESNLKQRQSVKGLCEDGKFEAAKCDFMMEIGPPSTKIYHFTGSIPLPSGDRIPLTKDNLLLRDCIIKNTDFIEGIVVYAGRETKAMLNNGGTRYKRSRLERHMNFEVVWCVVILLFMCLVAATGSALWQNLYEDLATVGSIPFIPVDVENQDRQIRKLSNNAIWVGFVNFWTFIILFQVIIPISLYVTIEVIKLMQIYHMHCDEDFVDVKSGKTIECRALNIPEELGQIQYVFTDKTGTLTENNMVFQRCSINGVDYAHTPVIAEGEDDERDSFLINLQLQEELTAVELPRQPDYGNNNSVSSSINIDAQRLADFFFILAACNTVIVAKHPRRDEMNASGVIVAPKIISDEGDNASTHSPRIPILTFGGKTQRLFRGFVSRPLSPIASSPCSTPPLTPQASPREASMDPCVNVSIDSPEHSFVHSNSFPINKNPVNLESTWTQQGPIPPRPNLLNLPGPIHSCPSMLSDTGSSPWQFKPIYEAESPDELALVDAASKYQYRLLRRTLHNILVSLPGEGLTEYEVLHVLPFDSTRKKMSIIVVHPETKDKILFCKGADSAIIDNLCQTIDDKSKFRIFRTQQHINLYSKKGLRVLCMAKRVLSGSEYNEWVIKHREAEITLSGQEHKLQESYARIEKNLILVGATGIEDRLQDGVPETIMSLRRAGIVVWVLTGDKQETAVNIAYSCSLFTQEMEIMKINARTRNQAEQTIRQYLQNFEDEDNNGSVVVATGDQQNGSKKEAVRDKGLVVDGKTLVFILDRRANLKKLFLMLASKCGAVLCCRATPLQKALVVKSAKEVLQVLTLAVGDGANDVSMIQTADVGIGISGKEGRQAIMASDFAIARFRHLEKLILVHGHWCYDRLARIILFFFYKNAFFVLTLFWYQLYNGFSGSVMVDQMYLMVFNLLFTSVPPIAVGIYDRDVPAKILLAKPALYQQGREGRLYRPHSFWLNILDAVYQSVVVFFLAVGFHAGSDVGVYELGVTVTHACLVAQLLHISLETKSWTVMHIAALVFSFLLFYAFSAFYTMTCPYCFGGVSQFGEFAHAMTSPLHWLTVLLTSIVAVLPRYTYYALRTNLAPDEITMALISSQVGSVRLCRRSKVASTSSVYRRPNYELKKGDEATEPFSV